MAEPAARKKHLGPAAGRESGLLVGHKAAPGTRAQGLHGDAASVIFPVYLKKKNHDLFNNRYLPNGIL